MLRLSANDYRHFWHQLMRKAFTSHAVALTQALGLPKRHQLTRYLILVSAFLISAAMHMLAAPGLERCSVYPQIRYYGSIVGAIVLEDIAVRTTRWIQRPSRDEKPKLATAYPNRRPALFWRVLGHVWVGSFHIWAGSKVIYGLWSSCSNR